jgi:hypothetical protein
MKIETIGQIAKKLGKQERTLEKPGLIVTLLKKLLKK